MKINNLILGFIALFFMNNAIASSSTVLYPENWQYLRNNLTLEPIATKANIGTRSFFSGGTLTTAMESAPLKTLIGASAAEAMGSAITMRAPVVMTSAKAIGIAAARALPGAILVTWLADMGFQYIAGEYQKIVPNTDTKYYIKNGVTYWLPSMANQYCQANGGGRSYGYMNGNYINCQWSAGNTYDERTYGPAINGIPPVIMQPATEADMTAALPAARDLTDSEIQAVIDAGWGIPVTSPKVAFSPLNNGTVNYVNMQQMISAAQRQTELNKSMPTVVANTLPDGSISYNYFPSPHAKTNPVTGEQSIEAINIQPASNLGVRISAVEYPVTSAGDMVVPQGQTNPTVTDPVNVDPCDLNPDRAGCASLGTPDETNPISTPKTITGDFNSFNISGQCPADKTFSVAGMTHTIQMSPICGAAQNYIKPFLLLMASVTAYFIFVGGLRT